MRKSDNSPNKGVEVEMTKKSGEITKIDLMFWVKVKNHYITPRFPATLLIKW